MLRRLRDLLAGSTALAVTGLLLAAPASAAGGPTSVFTIEGTAGSSLYSAPYDTVPGATATIDTGGTQVSLTTPANDQWTVVVTAPTGATLAAGQTYPVLAAPDAGDGAISVVGPSATCATPSGTVVVEQLTTSGPGDLTAFAASYAVRCADTEPLVYGELRFAAVDDAAGTWSSYPVAVRSPSAIDFGAVRQGGSLARTLTLTSQGTEPLVPAVPAVTGDPAGDFSVTSTCDGATPLGTGDSCTVTVTAAPPVTGSPAVRTASLVIDLGSSGLATRVVPLTVSELPSAAGRFFPVTPARVLDTRVTGGPFGTATPGGATRAVAVAGVAGVPAAGVDSVVLNVTVVNERSQGFVTVYPTGVDQPTASNLNVRAGQIRANSVTTGLGADGSVSVVTNMSSTDLVVDVTGYYANADVANDPSASGSTFVPATPRRLLDTRTAADGPALRPQETVVVPVAIAGAAAADVSALAVNVTAVVPNGTGYLTAWSGTGPTTTSTVNFTPGAITPNFAVVPTSISTLCGAPCTDFAAIAVQNHSAGEVHVIVDLFGYYTSDPTATSGSVFHAVTPTRVADSRSGVGGFPTPGPGATVTVTPPAGLLPAGTSGVAMNLTGVSPTQGTFLTAWPNGTARPGVSNLNLAPGDIVPNAVVVGVDASGSFSVYNLTGDTDVVADVDGYFTPVAPAPARRVAATATPGPLSRRAG